MAKYIYILFFILLKVAYINAANKIVISDSSKLKGVSVETYTVKVRTLNPSGSSNASYVLEDTGETFDVLNIANPEMQNFEDSPVELNVSLNNLEALDIDQKGLYINNEVINNLNVVYNNNVYGTLNNHADIIILNINLPTITNINGAVKVLGNQAALIIQNINGTINCNSCSFGNIDYLKLTANAINLTNANLNSINETFTRLDLVSNKLSVAYSDIAFRSVFLYSLGAKETAGTISVKEGSITGEFLYINSNAGIVLDNVLLNVRREIEAVAETYNNVYLREVNYRYTPNLTLQSKINSVYVSKRDTNTRFKQFNEVSLIAPVAVYLHNIEILAEKISIDAGFYDLRKSTLQGTVLFNTKNLFEKTDLFLNN